MSHDTPNPPRSATSGNAVRWHMLCAAAASTALAACVTNPPAPSPAPAPASATTGAAAPATSSAAPRAAPAAPTCETLPTMSNDKKVAVGAAIGALSGAVIGSQIKGNRTQHAVTGALGGALVGALAGSAFKNDIDVEEQADGSVRLKIPGRLMFASGQSSLSPGFQSTLANVTTTVKKYCGVTVRVVGHTDNVGDRRSNQSLSDQRARAVQGFMQNQGMERMRVFAEGHGQDEPIAPNTNEEGRQQNRRVEVYVRPPAS